MDLYSSASAELDLLKRPKLYEMIKLNGTSRMSLLNGLSIKCHRLQRMIKNVSRYCFSIWTQCCVFPTEMLLVAQSLKVTIRWAIVYYFYPTAQNVPMTCVAYFSRIYREYTAVTVCWASKNRTLQRTLLDFVCFDSLQTGQMLFGTLYKIITRGNMKMMIYTIILKMLLIL